MSSTVRTPTTCRSSRTGRRRTPQYHALLPTDVKAGEVGATLSDGVLTVTVPKAQAAKPQHVEITGS
ncbi:Hsp20/alpha crystallin family protein [Streptomyces sp. NPDC020845]|uniref:Hsp20/alpha crystallin family protein n=1 Tax=Streptomyces sp. NPDC020845 TaxID=3365096 RepID=UPI0037A337A9